MRIRFFTAPILVTIQTIVLLNVPTSANASVVNVYGNPSPENGRPAYVVNLIAGDADSTTGPLVSEQNAYGLPGGWSPFYEYTVGGYATSILEYTDTRASFINASTFAQGGEGGMFEGLWNYSGVSGGNASATTNIDMSSSGQVKAVAIGGTGGYSAEGCENCPFDGGIDGGYGGKGGDASAHASGISRGLTGTLESTAIARGGIGGSASGPGYSSGAGGIATASASGKSTSGQDVIVTANQISGDGGDARRGDANSTSWSNSGNGGDSIMVDRVWGETTGNLKLTQSSTAGNGGGVTNYGYLDPIFTGRLGSGGDAESSLTFEDLKASSLSIIVDAQGGNAGKVTGNEGLRFAPSAGTAGNAKAAMDVSYSGKGVPSNIEKWNFVANSEGGTGGDSYNGSDATDGGNATTNSRISSDKSTVLSGTNALSLRATSVAGNGGNALTGTTGHAGSGGNGGNAETNVVLDVGNLTTESVYAAALAGNGGKGNNGSGGNGGSAATSVNATSQGTAGTLRLTADATGGTGGSASSSDFVSGKGGIASASAIGISTSGQDVNVSATQKGGDGGNASRSETNFTHWSSAGNGANSVMTDQVSGETTGKLELAQTSIAGNGGGIASDTYPASLFNERLGHGGSAESNLSFVDTKASSLSITVEAQGGNAGKPTGVDTIPLASSAGMAGNAKAVLDVSYTGKGASSFVAKSKGGIGGDSYNGSDATTGGNATTSLVISTEKPAVYAMPTLLLVGPSLPPYAVKDSIKADASSVGGNGGSAFSPGNGVNGGNAQTSVSVDASNVTSMTIQATASGGKGGNGFGNSYSGGDGGLASVMYSIAASPSDAYDISYTSNQINGDGGDGLSGAKGGNGASAHISNTISDLTSGALRFSQLVAAGNGGNSTMNDGGSGGTASSILNVEDNSANLLSGSSYADAGFGGKSYSATASQPYGNGYGKGGDSYSETNLSSSVSGASVTASAGSNSSIRLAPDNNPRPPRSVHDYLYYFSGDSTARASASGFGTKNFTKATASIAGETGYAEARSTLIDSSNNKLITKTSAPMANTGLSVSSYSTSGYAGLPREETYNYLGSFYSHSFAKSLGNIASTMDAPQKSTDLGSASGDFTLVGNGLMWAERYNVGDDPEQFDMYANYTFSSLEVGNSLLFGLQPGSLFSDPGITTFTLTRDNKILYSSTFSTSEDWASFNSMPLYLGEISGTTSLELAMSSIMTERDSAIKMQYAFVVAPYKTLSGTFKNVAAVPLPAAAPLFMVALGGLGLFGKRRKDRKPTEH